MECTKSSTAEHWQKIAGTLKWAEENLRRPLVNCVETWYHRSRQDLDLMRAVTTLTLTHSNGYCLFSDPNPLPGPDHLHDWYSFWEKNLGKPISGGVNRVDGTVGREFENGTVVYNPMGNKTVTVVFAELRTSVASGKSSKRHQLSSPDGDIFLRFSLRELGDFRGLKSPGRYEIRCCNSRCPARSHLVPPSGRRQPGNSLTRYE